MQVLRTKLSRPTTLNPVIMQRANLFNHLQQYRHKALLFIHAAAGYGKTMLMCQLSDQSLYQGKQIHWLTLDVDDNDPIRLFQYLWLSLLGLEQLSSVPEGQINKHNILELLDQIAPSGQQHVLLIDELDVLENSDCLNMIWWLYQYLPSNINLIIASRIKPEWNFSKEILQGRLYLADERLLSVKSEEIPELIEFLSQQNFENVALSSDQVQLLIEKTEGWITGIQLTNLYLKKDHDANSIIQNLSGIHNQIVDYLSEQVFLQLPEEMQFFLMQISVLRKVNLGLIQEVTAHSQASPFLDTIKHRGLFMQAVDEQRQWYRIHHLFRDFLENRFKLFDIDKFKQAHSKAAYWYKKQHFLMEAIYHAQQADNQELALDLLVTVSRELILEGRIYSLLELVKQLPEHILIKHLNLLYDVIWSLLLTRQNQQANYFVKLWDSLEESPNLILKEDQLGIAPLIALLEDDLAQAYVLAQQNLEKLTESAYFSRGPLIGICALYQICMGKISEARKLVIQTRAAYVQGCNLYGLVFTDCIDATCERLMGNLSLAEEKFNQIGKSADYIKLGIEHSNHAVINAITSSLKADLYYEMNKIELAELALQDFNGGDQLVIPDMVIIGYVLQLRLAHLREDVVFEQTCLTQSQIKTNDWSLPRLAKTVQMVNEYQYGLEQADVTYTLESDKDNLQLSKTAKQMNITNLLIGDDLLIYRRLIFNGEIEKAIDGLLFEAQLIIVYPLRQLRIQLLQTIAHYQLAQYTVAYEYLEKALSMLMSTQAVRIILDEHPLIWEILGQFNQYLNKKKRQSVAPLFAYIQYLFTLSPSTQKESIVLHTKLSERDSELLSKREIQILEKVSDGSTDAEISEYVFLSVNTVKWHLRNIYNKLQVRSRLEAVKDAKKRGLIH
ncbi:LuxR C-terminal-related transcriptional regulator [Acinetobacter rongchengensis]|uniref:Helix-turn-helix transcriptional regulator n=1 Tax=Acinetobacter rongchengensis TaxID=2419601 RepID=A0A3A8ESD0_9GAMM|nr:LuxR C-terminal-related transcriptional regulator [Acinetobacter rongchengensis]RKG37782.1 helix-turn-helix transcriptional regulator [Acinetobacter rongchengensis]